MEIFEDHVLEMMIQDTGGSLRDLFQGINSAAKRAQRRESPEISMEDGRRAMEELKTALTKRIEEKDYDFLIKIFN